MRRGGWFQCGDKSQVMAREMLNLNLGSGVVISSRDVTRNVAVGYATEYHQLGAHVLLDLQFYRPAYTNPKLQTYELTQFRTDPVQLQKLLLANGTDFENGLRTLSADLAVDGVIAPAMMYEGGRPDIAEANRHLFNAARRVAEQMQRPVYATVSLARSVTSSEATLNWALGQVTALHAHGWYLAFEFNDERIPSGRTLVGRFMSAALSLACTGLPVFHAFAGPMAILSPACGCTAVGIGHSQNLWHFDIERWAPAQGQGGGGDAPARFFSSSLWGTIVTPDELLQLPASLRQQIITTTPFSTGVGTNPPQPWSKWTANKHLVYSLADHVASIPQGNSAAQNANDASARLQSAVNLHNQVANAGIALRDQTNAYQNNWRLAIQDVLQTRGDDYDYLALL